MGNKIKKICSFIITKFKHYKRRLYFMTSNEKTFEQGVAVGMLLSKGIGQGPNTYNLKDQLFKYILENGKIIGTCKVGNNCVKLYIGLVHYSDPNAKLFWTLQNGNNIRGDSLRLNEIDYSREGDIVDSTDPTTPPFVRNIAPLIMSDEGVIEYYANIFFSEDDEPLFGSVVMYYNYAGYCSEYITNSPNTTSAGIKDIVCWPEYFYSGLEEAIDAVEYMGDIESYICTETYKSVGKTKLRITTKYRDSSGADVSGSGNLNIVFKQCTTSTKWRQTTVQNPDGTSAIVDDTTKLPIVTKNDPYDYNLSMPYYYNIFPQPIMVADNVTDKDIANVVANAYDVLYKNAEGPAANKLLGVELRSLLTPQ